MSMTIAGSFYVFKSTHGTQCAAIVDQPFQHDLETLLI